MLEQEFEPEGLVENALIERVAVSLWRQRRLVAAESAEVSINRQRFGDDELREVCRTLDLNHSEYLKMRSPEVDDEDVVMPVRTIKSRRDRWESILKEYGDLSSCQFADLPADVQKSLLDHFQVAADEIDALVKKQFRSWVPVFKMFYDHYRRLVNEDRIRKLRKLLLQRQTLPSRTDLLGRYQTALDNDLYKALKALREAQAWRQARLLISANPALPEPSN